jgi:hypothetical protein
MVTRILDDERLCYLYVALSYPGKGFFIYIVETLARLNVETFLRANVRTCERANEQAWQRANVQTALGEENHGK